MTDPKKDPHPHLPGGTGTGPAGGEPVKPTTPARDPAAEAAALAAFEADEKGLAEKDLPAERRAPPTADDSQSRRLDTEEPTVRAKPMPGAPKIESGTKMAPLGTATAAPPVVVFDKVTKTYGTGSSAFTAIKDVTF